MNTTTSKRGAILLWTLLWLVGIGMTAYAKPGDITRKKSFTKSYNVNASDKLQVDNKYGSITITHWNRDEVAIQVDIEVSAGAERKADDLIDRITIATRKEHGVVSATTNIQTSKGGFSGGHTSMDIKYHIQMPARLAAELEQKYGNIHLPESNPGPLDITVKYGQLSAGDITAPAEIELRYSNLEAGTLKGTELDISYAGSVRIKAADRVTIDSKYSTLSIDKADQLRMEVKYGSFRIEQGADLDLEIGYSKGEIESLDKQLKVDGLSYSNLTIEKLSPRFTGIAVEAHYGNLSVNAPAKASFRIVAENMRYGDCSVKNLNDTKSSFEEDNYTHTYEINGGKQPVIHFDGGGYGNLRVRGVN